jgi:hypothetical protein
VRAKRLDTQSREVTKSQGERIAIGSRSWEDRWIRNPIAFRTFGGSEVERSRFQHHNSRSVES